MEFGKRLREKRAEANLSQDELAKKAGVGSRTICNYETGARMPNSLAIVSKLAKALGTTSTYLLGEDGLLVVDAAEKGTPRDKRNVQDIIDEVAGLYAGGSLSAEDKENVFRALSEAYWDSKDKNAKYTPKKYRK